jgi:SnoaL-like domain
MSDINFVSSLAAEAAFYKAFEHADIGAMMAVWAEGGDIVCIHVAGQRRLADGPAPCIPLSGARRPGATCRQCAALDRDELAAV